MPNSFDAEGRGPSTARLAVVGMVFVAIAATTVSLLIAKSRGALDPFVRVSAELVNVGDGLPTKSDVKFRGVLVGFVSGITPAQSGHPNIVRLNLKPQYAAGIPDTVTARVVPSNVFAVSSVQLVDNGTKSRPLRGGAVIHEDQTLPTVLFQTTVEKFRQVLAAIGREPNDNSVGWLTTLGDATSGRGDRLQAAAHDLNEIVTQLNTVVSGEPGPSTISALTAATTGLRTTAPELLDSLDVAVRPMRTLAEKQVQLTNFLSAASGTIQNVGDAFNNQSDRLINITTKLTPVLGTLADHGGTIHSILMNAQELVTTFVDGGWNWETNQIQAKAVVALTPSRTYVRADCPRYGDMLGPSCFTAPEVPTAPALTPALGSVGLPLPPGVNENRPNYAPPRGSVLPPDAPRPDGPAQPGGPPGAVPPDSSQAPPQPFPPPLPAEAPPPDSGAVPQAAIIGGNIGPVGSRQEKSQLGYLLGGNTNVATELLFAPLVRGTAVHLAPAQEGP
ncbi:MCE family protein [Mycolicibacterium boenickei]|nr:MCE family protein [Mycolicibacterium boenickei]